MKATRNKVETFEPVTLTIETQEEFDILYQVGNCSGRMTTALREVSSPTRSKYSYCKVDTVLSTLWSQLRKVQ
jgi:hypothetical protein